MLATAVADGSQYALAIISMLALRSGWHPEQVDALLAGKDLGEEKTDALSAWRGRPRPTPGASATPRGPGPPAAAGDNEQLAEAFAYLGLTVFTSYFLNYAATELDIPAGLPGPEGE